MKRCKKGWFGTCGVIAQVIEACTAVRVGAPVPPVACFPEKSGSGPSNKILRQNTVAKALYNRGVAALQSLRVVCGDISGLVRLVGSINRFRCRAGFSLQVLARARKTAFGASSILLLPYKCCAARANAKTWSSWKLAAFQA